MARPKKDEAKARFTVMLEPSLIKEIEEIAKKAEMPPGTFARNLIKTGLDEAKFLDGFGLVRLVGSSRRKLDQIKKQFGLSLDSLDTNTD